MPRSHREGKSTKEKSGFEKALKQNEKSFKNRLTNKNTCGKINNVPQGTNCLKSSHNSNNKEP
jgi:hypothetical protein